VTAKSTQKTIKTIFLSTFKKIILKTKPKKKKEFLVFQFKIQNWKFLGFETTKSDND
jgi:hypothetical protein